MFILLFVEIWRTSDPSRFSRATVEPFKVEHEAGRVDTLDGSSHILVDISLILLFILDINEPVNRLSYFR